MADPVIVPLVNNTWTLVATAVMSAQIYPRGTGGPPPAMFRFTYRATGGAAPVNDAGVVVGLGDRDHAAPSYRAEFGGPVDLYIFAVTSATTTAECEVHATVGGAARETQPAIVVNNQAVAADPGVSYAPGVDGIVMDGYKDIAFELYLLGGIGAAATNRTVTVVFQGSNDVEVPVGTRQWVTLAVGYDLGTDLTAASWVSVGNVALVAQVDFDNWEHKRIRVMYDWDGDPSVTNGIISITERRKAL